MSTIRQKQITAALKNLDNYKPLEVWNKKQDFSEELGEDANHIINLTDLNDLFFGNKMVNKMVEGQTVRVFERYIIDYDKGIFEIDYTDFSNGPYEIIQAAPAQNGKYFDIIIQTQITAQKWIYTDKEPEKPADGATGAAGKNGVNAYTHIKYSANATGSGMVDTPSSATIYMGVYSGTSSTAPTATSSYKWFKTQGPQGVKGDTGAKGADGFNPYWKTTGSTILVANNGERDLKGDKGDTGPQGLKGDTGAKGDTGLKGDTGDVGKSAYQVWLDEGNTGTISAYLDSLKGDKGDTGEQGNQGEKGDAGSDANVTKDNVEIALGYTPLPQSGGILNDYTEKLITTTGAINLNLGNVFHRNATTNTTFSITGAKYGVAHSFTLIITMGATVRTLGFPVSVKWRGWEIPDMTEANKTYILTLMTINSGTTWFGMEGGSF